MNQNEQIKEFTLGELQQAEEALRVATAEAQSDLEQGRTTEAVFEDLRGRYFVAKQAREDFESNS